MRRRRPREPIGDLEPMNAIRENIRRALGRFHGRSRGAVALMTLAAILICFMLALVIYDADHAAMDKIDVQSAADMAAWSQSAVEARSMNMASFANVGKRMVFGMTASYQAVWVAWTVLIGIVSTLAVACWAACVWCGSCLEPICTPLSMWTVYLGGEMANESMDFSYLRSHLLPDYFERDMEMLDRYQEYMLGRDSGSGYTAGLAPWWSWSESLYRGMSNGALTTASWPPPAQVSPNATLLKDAAGLGAEGLDLSRGTEIEDRIPAQKYTRNNLGQRHLCDWMRNDYDTTIHSLDYALRSYLAPLPAPDKKLLRGVLTTDRGGAAPSGTRSVYSAPVAGNSARAQWVPEVSYLITALFAHTAMQVSFKGNDVCQMIGSMGWEPPAPYELRDLGRADWLMRTSNTALAYKPDAARTQSGAAKYDFMTTDYTQSVPVPGLYDSGGYWGVSRSEVSYQYEAEKVPDLWHAGWTVRMRPLALPGEWENYRRASGAGSFRFGDAVVDMLPYIAASGGLAEAYNEITGQNTGPSISKKMKGAAIDMLRVYLAADGMDDETIEGVGR